MRGGENMARIIIELNVTDKVALAAMAKLDQSSAMPAVTPEVRTKRPYHFHGGQKRRKWSYYSRKQQSIRMKEMFARRKAMAQQVSL